MKPQEWLDACNHKKDNWITRITTLEVNAETVIRDLMAENERLQKRLNNLSYYEHTDSGGGQ